MIFIIILIIVVVVVIAVKSTKKDFDVEPNTFAFDTSVYEGYKKHVNFAVENFSDTTISSLGVLSNAYQKSDDVITTKFNIDEHVPKYAFQPLFPARLELNGDTYDVFVKGNTRIGNIKKGNTSRITNLLKNNDCYLTVKIEEGPCKVVIKWDDEKTPHVEDYDDCLYKVNFTISY